MRHPSHESIADGLQAKVKTLNASVWQQRADWRRVVAWTNQFAADTDPAADEQLHALYLLTHFLYFGDSEIRALLKSLYRDHIRYKMIKNIRKGSGDTRDLSIIDAALMDKIKKTRFVSLGNPAESSAMMLYLFRQENDLPKNIFSNAFDLFTVDHSTNTLTGLRIPDLDAYIFIDDLCGSGDQGKSYASSVVASIKSIKPDIEAHYYALFGVDSGLQSIRDIAVFDTVEAVIELDNTFKCFDSSSRIYTGESKIFDRVVAKKIAQTYGEKLWPKHPLGYKDGQLVIGFSHNTPDNTLPIFWYDWSSTRWASVFKRYPKIDWKYGAY